MNALKKLDEKHSIAFLYYYHREYEHRGNRRINGNFQKDCIYVIKEYSLIHF